MNEKIKKHKVVVVEDEEVIRKMLAMELEEAGYEVHQAGDGDEGYKLILDVGPDIIITDIVMPNVDGNQMMKKLRESDFGRNIPVIILTARSLMKDYFEIMEVDAFIDKPFQSKDVIAKVDEIIKKYSLRNQVEEKLQEVRQQLEDRLKKSQKDEEKSSKSSGPREPETPAKPVAERRPPANNPPPDSKNLYKYCDKCRKPIPDYEATRCPRCGTSQIVIKEKAQ